METQTETIAAVVITFNRKDLLRKNLGLIQGQSRALDEIIVIDNGSKDGTVEMVRSEFPDITLEPLSENFGISGGAAHGLEFAHSRGHDWFWIMDDDGFPKNDALEQLDRSIQTLKPEKFCLYSSHLEPTEEFYTEPIGVIDGDKVTHVERFAEAVKLGSLIPTTGGPFLGFLVPREAVEQVGVPNPGTFIWGDFEYLSRLRQHGFKIYYCTKSILHHPRPDWYVINLPTGLFKSNSKIWKTFSFPKAPVWKYYYGIRNSLFTAMPYNGEFYLKIFIKVLILQLVRVLVLLRFEDKRLTTLKFCFWAIFDGLRGKLGKRIDPEKLH